MLCPQQQCKFPRRGGYHRRQLHDGHPTDAVANFTEIEASRVSVVYTQGPLTAARIEAPDNVLEHVRVYVDGETLHAEIDRSYNVNFHDNQGVTITVSSPAVDEVFATVAGRVTLGNITATDDLELHATTSAAVTADTVRVAGDVETFATTGARVSVTALTCSEFKADATTAGTISVGTLTAEEVEGDVTTGSSITLAGSAVEVDFTATTGGSLEADALAAERGEATATTGAEVNCNIARPSSLSSTTGGSVNNRRR